VNFTILKPKALPGNYTSTLFNFSFNDQEDFYDLKWKIRRF